MQTRLRGRSRYAVAKPRLTLPVFVLAVAGAGCGMVEGLEAARFGSAPVGGEAVRRAASAKGGAGVAFLLLGAKEGADIDEIDAGPVPAGVESLPGKAPTQKSRRLAARVGLILAGGAKDEAREPGLLAGVGYDLPFGGSGSFGLELGADFGSMSDKSGDLLSDITVLAAAARYAPGGGGFYLIGGASAMIDKYVNLVSDEEGSSLIPLAEIGLGLRAASGRLDMRATYMVLVGSENVPGLLAARLGFVF